MAEACLDWFEVECLYSAAVAEFHVIEREAGAGDLRIPERDIRQAVGSVIPWDWQAVDVD